MFHLTLRNFCWAATGSSGTSVIGILLQAVIYLGGLQPFFPVNKGVEKILVTKFLPRDASAQRGDATVSRLSVHLSVCP